MRLSSFKHVSRPLVATFLVALLTMMWHFGEIALPKALGESGDGNPGKASAQKSEKKDTKEIPKAATHQGRECTAVDHFFADEVWAKVGERTCLKCHNADGDASISEFLLLDTSRNRGSLGKNRAAFAAMAKLQEEVQEKSKSRLLTKVTGGLEHGGGVVLKPDSSGYRILERFVSRLSRPGGITAGKEIDLADDLTPLFDGVQMATPERLLRRVTLSLSGRLPSVEEKAAVKQRGMDAIDTILDSVMQEDAFYERLREGFNDILLTRGYDGTGELVLSYDHFSKTRLWYQQRDPRKGLSPEKKKELPYSHPKMVAYTKLIREYREGLRREPLAMIEHIVRNNLPITELVTADYIMVTPSTARGYGIFEKVQDQFKDLNDPFEYIPAKLPALVTRGGKVQESKTGFYPHAGLLSSFQYLKRYPTSETNRNRLRVRMYFLHFLGIDLMQLAPRVNDAAAITSEYEIPTMQAADCVVCHKVMDPIAGLYQDFYVVDGKGIFGPRKEGWFKDIFTAGLEGEELPADQRWRSLQWLGQRTAKDPRFAVAMVEHVYYFLMGRKVLMPPEDIDDPMFGPKRRAYKEQRQLIEDVAKKLSEADFNLKVAFKRLVASDFYRVDGLATIAKDPKRQAELDDIGLVRMLTPEQLERKIEAVLGQKWGALTHRESKFKILYGGIDSKSVTERALDPSGAMGAIQRIMSNDVACKNVALDFSRPPSQRVLFPGIELDVVPGDDPDSEAKIRQAIVDLHQRVLGRTHAADHAEVERTYQLFAGIVGDAQSTKGIDKRGSYNCDRIDGQRLDDPHYTLRAWRGVVTYLLRQHDFLYE